MAENGKIALMGFDRLKLFPILKNNSSGYEVGDGFSMPWVQSMTKEKDVAEQKIYGDDSFYLNVVNFNGLNVELNVIEMPLDKWAELGFGEYDETTKTLKWNPQGKNLEFGATFRCQQANGEYRMYRMFRFTISSIEESETNTKGSDANVQPYKIVGNFAKRAFDGQMGEIHDGSDAVWLDSIPEAANP